jgi:hypothetical protein
MAAEDTLVRARAGDEQAFRELTDPYRGELLRGAPLRLVPTRANTQPAFGCYLPCAHTPIARPYGLIVLTLRGDHISAITWFSDSSVFPHFGLPRALPR